jgi:hypothetical protein
VVPLLLVMVHVLVFLWLRKWRPTAKTESQSWRATFRPSPEIRIFFIVLTASVAALLIWCFISLGPSEWWLPYACLEILLLIPFLYPRVLTITVEGIESRTLLGSVKKLRWENVAALEYNAANRHFAVLDKDGLKMVHTLVHVDGNLFQILVRERTRLPTKVTLRGFWKRRTVSLRYNTKK